MNPGNPPAIEEFLERARKDGLIDQIASSAFVMVMEPGRANLQMALQAGLALLFDKPLMLVLQKGETIPQRLRDLADEIVQFEEGGLQHPSNQAKLTAGIWRMTEKMKAKEQKEGI